MKIAVTIAGADLEAPVDQRFGRAPAILAVDADTLAWELIPNPEAETRPHGAGIGVADKVARAGCTVVLTGVVGPKAFDALGLAGIRVVQNLQGVPARDAVARFASGELAFSDAALSPGHG